MPELTCTSRRIGDYESRTEEYELIFAVGDVEQTLRIRYQAARAYEINAALDASVETVRGVISTSGLHSRPTDTEISQLAWRTLQSVKYEEGGSKTRRLEI